MWTWLKTNITAFLYDPAVFKLVTRAVLGAVAVGGVAFAQDLSIFFNAPWISAVAKGLSIISGFIALAIKMGDKNPTPDQVFEMVQKVKARKLAEAKEK
jgi:hypothetical protein